MNRFNLWMMATNGIIAIGVWTTLTLNYAGIL